VPPVATPPSPAVAADVEISSAAAAPAVSPTLQQKHAQETFP
jgi:hypothetical protein